MEILTTDEEKELYYNSVIDQLKVKVPDSMMERTQFLNILSDLIEEDESSVPFKAKVNILHKLAMYCGSFWITILPYPFEPEL